MSNNKAKTKQDYNKFVTNINDLQIIVAKEEGSEKNKNNR